MSRPRWFLATALLALLALGAAALAQTQLQGDTYAPVVDSEAYLLQGLRVAAGEDIVEGVYFQAPFYPLLLGSALRLAGVPGSTGAERIEDLPPEVLAQATAVGRALNVLAGLVLVWLVWRLGCSLFDEPTGWCAALLAALYGPTLFYQAHLLKVSVSLLFLPWTVLALVRAWASGRARGFVWVGLAMGLGGLVRGNMHLVVLLALVALLAHGWVANQVRSSLWRCVAMAAGVALALTPVIVRNSLVAGYPVLSTAAGGTAFYLCNHAGNTTGLVQAIPTNRQVPRHEFGDWEQAAEAATGLTLSPAEISSYWFDQALAEIAADPQRWLLAEARKLGLLFSRYEAPDNTLVALGEEESWLLDATPSRWAVVMPLAVGGVLLAWRRRRNNGHGNAYGMLGGVSAEGGASAHGAVGGVVAESVEQAQRAGRVALALALSGYGASLLLFNMSARFRMPLAPLAMVFAGYLLAALPSLLQGLGEPQGRKALGGVLLALVLGAAAGRASEGPLGPLDAAELATHRAVRYKNRAQVAAGRGDLVSARADLQRALNVAGEAGKVSPDLFVLGAGWDRAEALNQSGSSSQDLAQSLRGRAIMAIQQALAIRPDHGPAQRMAGLLLYDEGAYEDAVAAFDRALAEVPRDREARQYQVLSLLALGDHAKAREGAALLVDQDPDRDDGHGLLALALQGLGNPAAARQALEEYDRLASRREAAGLSRRLPETQTMQQLRLELDPK